MNGLGLEWQYDVVVKSMNFASRLPGFDLSCVTLDMLLSSVPQFSHLQYGIIIVLSL